MTESTDIVPIRHLRAWLGAFTAAELSNKAYHAAPGISKSHLDTIADGSPLHYWQRYVNPERPVEEKTPALILGDSIHAAILQPHLFEKQYAAKPEGLDKRTTKGKEAWEYFLRQHPGKTHISHTEYEICLGIRETIYRHPVARGLLVGGVAEHSFFHNDPETGALIKCRPDYLTADYVLDLKSTLDAGEESFGRDATNMRYDVAVPWYMDIVHAVSDFQPKRWIWLAVEKTPPYAVGIYFAQDHDIIAARDTARRNLHTILNYRKLNTWPDYGEKIRPLILKSWKKR
jgi:hypothetical protein